MLKKYFSILSITLSLFSCSNPFDEEKEIVKKINSNSNVSKRISATNLSLNPDRIWGVNGHPINQEAYRGNIDLQLDLIKEVGFNYYRVDMDNGSFSQNGVINADKRERFEELLLKSKSASIKILPVLMNDDYKLPQYTKDDAYYIGYTFGYGFASAYAMSFDHYALGNEEERFCLRCNLGAGNTDPRCSDGSFFPGNQISDYDPVKLQKVAYYLNGLIEGVKAKDPTAKVIVNCAGWVHYGFFSALKSYNVNYDIIGYHWYVSNEAVFDDVLNNLQNFNKDVWITELNKYSMDESLNEQLAQKNFVKLYLDKFQGKSFVKAIFLHELFNQPPSSGTPSVEHLLGITYWNTNNYFNYSKKPVIEVLKFKVEENKYGYEDFIYSLFLYCNERVADPGGLNYWRDKLMLGNNIPTLLNEFLPEESYGVFVERQYQSLLDHPGINKEVRDYWKTRMKNGITREQVISELCNSQEFWERSGAFHSGFVDRLFIKLLSRPSNATEKNYWISQLNSGTSRYNVAMELLKGDEYLRIFIINQFNQLLRRKGVVEESSINFYKSKMQSGKNQQEIIKELLSSDEYWQRGVQEGYLRKYPYPLN